MNNLVNLIRENINDSINLLGYDLYHVEFVNELGHRYLRVMIENKDKEQKITIKDCEIVAKTINPLIDELDIKDKFFLEVSSPGVNRKLYTYEHMKNSEGKYVSVKLTKSIDGSKRYNGILKSVNNNEIILKTKERELKINLDMIKNINLEEISQEDIHE